MTTPGKGWWPGWRTLFGSALTAGTAAALFFLRFGSRALRRTPSGLLKGQSLKEEINDALKREAADDDDDDPMDADEAFEQAASWVSSDDGGDLDTELKLSLYGCFKQATVGDCPQERRPWGMEAGMKWEAWNERRGDSESTAKRLYVKILDKAVPEWSSADGPSAPTGSSRKKGGGQTISTGPTVSIMAKDPELMGGPREETPIGELCERVAEGDIEEVQSILRSHPGLAFMSDKDGMTPLHWAADRDQPKAAKLLLEHVGSGAEALERLGKKDSESGYTALHYAVITESLEVVEMLVSHGADPELANDDGETALDLADNAALRKALLGGKDD